VSQKTEVVVRRAGAVVASRSLAEGIYTVGRIGADIVVDDEELAPQHLQLSVSGRGLFLTDLGSGSGTFIQGCRIHGSTRLDPSETARLGAHIELEVRTFESHESRDPDGTLPPSTAALQRCLPEFFALARKYDRGEMIDEGGMGVVLEARETMTGRRIAMKLMKESGAAGGDLRRFVEEACITAMLEHPNIVPIHELGIDDDEQLFYTMKLVEGATLREILQQLSRDEPAAVARYTLQALLIVFQKVCDGIAFAHSRGVIHRDLKPANVMIGAFGEVLVMDWGLARKLGDGTPGASPDDEQFASSTKSNSAPRHGELTIDRALAGTPTFMAPEQASGKTAALDERTDIYALGAILQSILTLQAPVHGSSTTEVLERVRTGRLEPLTGASRTSSRPHLPRGRVPDSLAAVVRRAMQLDPAHRYSSVAELQGEIAAYQSGFATEAEQASFFKQVALAVQRHRREAFVLLACVLVIMAVSAAAFVRIYSERRRATTALDELRNAAPVFAAQARALAMQQDIDGALQKLEYALTLRPGATEYLLQKGDLLESRLRFAEAAAVYQSVLAVEPAHMRAQQHAALCTELHTRRGDPVRFKAALARLLAAMSRAQRLHVEMIPVALAYGLKPAVAERLQPDGNGFLVLDLSHDIIASLDMLRGLPIATLNLTGCKDLQSLEFARDLPLHTLNLENTGITDLAPLAAAATLHHLNIAFTPVRQLEPLRALQLTSLDCSGVPALDFTPLASLPLEKLWLQNTAPGDLSFVAAMPLKLLTLEGCTNLRNLAALRRLPDLQALCLPARFYELSHNELQAVVALSAHPALRQLSAQPCGRGTLDKVEARERFRTTWLRDLGWIQAVERAGHSFVRRKLADGTWEVDLRDQPIDDLTPLTGAPISVLNLFNTPVHDLSPLRGMPLRALDLRRSSVTDLAPLRGAPLRELYLWTNKIADYSVLAEFTALEVFDASETNLDDLTPLRTTKLRMLRIGSSKVRDLSPLAGLRLEKIHFDNVPVDDARPLADCAELRWIVPNRKARNIELLRTLPKLERISYSWNSESEPAQTTQEFWREFDQPWTRALRLLDVSFSAKARADGSWSVTVHTPAFHDLQLVAGAPISELILEGSSVQHLGPLRSLPLTHLNISGTPVEDLSPLAGLPLRVLQISGTRVSNLAPLRSLPLEEFHAERCEVLNDFAVLSELPTLKKLRVTK
jgi:serine/threonine protein kinase/Leucine-rich repeat (LRR) protein